MFLWLIAAFMLTSFLDPSGGMSLVTVTGAREAPRVASFTLATDKFSEKAAAVLNHLARENFKRAKEFRLINVRAILEGQPDDSRLAVLQKSFELMLSGKEQYHNLELDAAIDELSRAVAGFRKAAGRLGNGRDYLETMLHLGAAYILAGDNELGADNFRKVALYDKRRTLDPKAFPPSMIEIFNRIKEEVTASPVGTVIVKSSPTAAEVYLNGVFKGITPIKLFRVPKGAHFVRLEKDGYLPWGQAVVFYPAHEEQVQASLQSASQFHEFEGMRKSLLGDLEDDPPRPELIRFGEWIGVDRLVLVTVTQRGDEVTANAVMIGVHPSKTISFRNATFSLAGPNFLTRGDAFFTSLYRDVQIPSAKKPLTNQPLLDMVRCNSDSDCSAQEVCEAASGKCIPYAPEGDRFYEKWWFWAIVGGGLAVAGGTTLLVWYLIQPDQGAIEFTF